MINKVSVDGQLSYGDFVITTGVSKCVLAVGLYDRSYIRLKAVGARIGINALCWKYNKDLATKDSSGGGYNTAYFPIQIGGGRDRFYYCLAISKKVGEQYMVTTGKWFFHDLYQLLMKKTKLPYLMDWMEPLSALMVEKGVMEEVAYAIDPQIYHFDGSRTVPLHGEEVPLESLRVWDCGKITDEVMENLLSHALKEGKVRITDIPQKPLNFKNFNDYLEKYGGKMVEKLEGSINPLAPLKDKVDGLALKEKCLFPPQAACVEGIKAMRKAGRYAILNEGMGVGKTLQAAAAVESSMVSEYMEKHPEVSLRDVYTDSSLIKYRVIVICPGHLVEKWQEEIRAEIPYAHVTVITGSLKELVKLREAGRKPSGREFYIISKDFAKLGSEMSPIPTSVKKMYPKASICADCRKEGEFTLKTLGKTGKAVCQECGGHNFIPANLTRMSKETGLVCPYCGELLLSINTPAKYFFGSNSEEAKSYVLGPEDFAKHTAANSSCYHCGRSLWGTNVRPVDVGGEYSNLTKRPPKWHKVSFYKNKRAKTRETAYVLKGNEYLYYGKKGYKELPREYGPRKVAPAHYIKNYLKGYFDFCIVDEAHKFEGAGTAQANAAHALIRASRFSLPLTGTITNGTAAPFFWLFWMVDPRKMSKAGYRFRSGDLDRFCGIYGCMETLYEAVPDAGMEFNTASRGRKIGQPKVKPGISPRIYIDFLLENTLQLDISDLSRYLPPLHEFVRTVDMPEEICGPYKRVIRELTEYSRNGEGMSALSVMLQFALSYPDKPYGRGNIMSAYDKDVSLACVDNFDEYREKLLPKEEELVKIINQEMSEGRNCFIYVNFTGDKESSILHRLQVLIERKCFLKNRVAVLESSSPVPIKREQWIKDQAKDGKRVIICNPKTVETGLDFCFHYEGVDYNFPTLIFFQMGYEMSVIWQASRRAYRLNQRAECRNYYLAYANTLQEEALRIMAEKQVATAAIQGKFSVDGLANMARGVDVRTQLAAALSKHDQKGRGSISEMFDALNQQNAGEGGQP